MSYEDSMPSMTIHSGLFRYIVVKDVWKTWDTFVLLFGTFSFRSVLSSASKLAVLNMEGNFGTFLTDDFFLDLLARNPLNKLATLDVSFNDQGGVGITLYPSIKRFYQQFFSGFWARSLDWHYSSALTPVRQAEGVENQ